MKKQIRSDRFKFDYEYYDADLTKDRMLHITIFGSMPMQVELWLDDLDQRKLKEVLDKKYKGGQNE